MARDREDAFFNKINDDELEAVTKEISACQETISKIIDQIPGGNRPHEIETRKVGSYNYRSAFFQQKILTYTT